MTTAARRVALAWSPPSLPLEVWLGAATAMAIGIFTLTVWSLGASELAAVIPGRVSMTPNTAICFLLLASGLLLRTAAQSTTIRGAGSFMIIVSATIAAVIGSQWITGTNLGIDELLFRGGNAAGTTAVGRLSPQTSLACIALAAAAFLPSEHRRGARRRGLIGVAFLLAAINLLDQLYAAATPSVFAGFTQMALPTAVGLIGLVVAVAAADPRETLFALLRAAGPAGILTRNMVGAAIAIPVVVGWLRLIGEHLGWYGSAYGAGLTQLAAMVLLLLAVSHVGGVLERSEASRRLAETERERAREEAETANRAKSEFLSRMSHELRTPLNSVLGFTQLLQADDLQPDQQESLTYISRAGRHLLALINEVLDISRIESGTLALSPEAVPVRETLEEVISFTRPMAAEHGVSVEMDATACDHFVMADRQRLRQALLNLMSNAIKYGGANGRVTVACRPPEDGRLRLEVTDAGPGIPEPSLARLFVPFDRLGAEQTAVEGTGIGLPLTKALVEAMNGEIGVESVVGEGSTFWISLRTTTEPAGAGAMAPDSGEVALTAGGERRILYIEDNEANIRLIERIVEQLPRTTLTTAMQGQQGLALASAERPHLIVLDLHLPDMSGLNVLRSLRGDAATRATPVLILTADASEAQSRALLAEGADAVLNKPLDVAEFERLVQHHLHNASVAGHAS